MKKLNSVTNTRHSREGACEEIERPHHSSSFPRKRESGGGRPQCRPGVLTARRIPAFAGMTKNYRRVAVSRRAEEPGGAEDNNPPITLVYSREGACEENERPHHSSSFPRKRESGGGRPQCRPGVLTPQRIPAFAGMTSVCNAVGFFHILLRGNEEVLSEGCRLPPRRGIRRRRRQQFVIPAKAGIRRRSPAISARCSYGATDSRFRGNDEELSEDCRFPPRRGIRRRRRQQFVIPAKAGIRRRSSAMSARCSYGATDSRFRGNDEVLSGGCRLPSRRGTRRRKRQ